METVYFGDRGTWVTYLQLALKRAGYALSIDGIYGQKTREALADFLKYGTGEVADEGEWQELLPYLTGYRTYVIQIGDSLWSIAGRMNSSVQAIITANQISDPAVIEPGEILVVPFRFSVVPTEVPYSSMLLDLVVKGLMARYPFLRQEIIGRSVMGRPIMVLRMGVGEKQFFYNAAFHANEWITTPLLLKFAEEYSMRYTERGNLYGMSTEYLYRNYELFLLPMVNPDGVDLVNGMLADDRLTDQRFYRQAEEIAADYPEIRFPEGWKANIDGIDLNLQFPAGWEQAKENKEKEGYVSPAPRDYVGEAPLVAPESRAVYEYTLKKDFRLILAYHTQGEVIYWKYLDYKPQYSEEIADYFGMVSGYEISETPTESGYAGYKDWFIMEYNRPGYTIEVGLGVNPLPLSQFEQIYIDNRLILLGGMTEPDRMEQQQKKDL